jgi:hypothetical protein
MRILRKVFQIPINFSRLLSIFKIDQLRIIVVFGIPFRQQKVPNY